jgi:osmotically-inducible protein OsmY
VTDHELKQKVEEELNRDPAVQSAPRIGVGVKDGIVSLVGHVESYSEKVAAEEVASGVSGVRALVNELDVRLPLPNERSDEDIARAAANALDWTTGIPRDQIKVTVEGGWITLKGSVTWYFQRIAAEAAVRDLIGVKGIHNYIEVQPPAGKNILKDMIELALARDAELYARSIQVETSGGTVSLRGKVHTLAEKMAAERLAWRAPGVQKVENAIEVAA